MRPCGLADAKTNNHPFPPEETQFKTQANACCPHGRRRNGALDASNKSRSHALRFHFIAPNRISFPAWK